MAPLIAPTISGISQKRLLNICDNFKDNLIYQCIIR